MNNSEVQGPVQIGAIAVGIAGAILGIIGLIINAEQFYQAYIFSFLFWMALSLGCLALFMIHNLVSGRWGFAIRPFLIAGSRTVMLMAVLFVPVILGLGNIYKWVDTTPKGGADLYLDPPFFIARAVGYFVIWIVLALLLSNWSAQLDENGDPATLQRIKRLSTGGIVLYMITASLAAIDWNLTLTMDWYSSSFGWAAIVRQLGMAFAFGTVTLAFFWNTEPMQKVFNKRAKIDLGVLVLVGVLAWAYMSFVQYFIMWSANLTVKVFWYEIHTAGSWQTFVTALIILHAVTVVLLLLPGVKRNKPVLAALAGGVLVLRVMEFFWLVMPTYRTQGFGFSWMDAVVFLGIGGLWVALFVWSLAGRPLVPENNPELDYILSHSEVGDYDGSPATDAAI